MGIVFAGFMKVFLPVIVVLPGLILFALQPEMLLQPWEDVRPAADRGYIHLLQTLMPVGLRACSWPDCSERSSRRSTPC